MKQTMLAVAICSALTSAVVAFAVAALVQPAVGHAGPDEQAVPAVVRAQRFELVDASGIVRAVLGVSPTTGWTTLALNDQDGKLHIGMAVATDQAGIALGQGDTHSHIKLSLVDEEPDIQVNNEAGATVDLGVNADGALGVAGVDQTGQLRAIVELANNGEPRIRLLDSKGNAVWSAP